MRVKFESERRFRRAENVATECRAAWTARCTAAGHASPAAGFKASHYRLFTALCLYLAFARLFACYELIQWAVFHNPFEIEIGVTMKGTIVRWGEALGFGYIQRDDGQRDVFTHITVLPKDFVPAVGMRVEFEVGTEPLTGRPCAVNVHPIEGLLKKTKRPGDDVSPRS